MISLKVNGTTRQVEAAPDTPLLWVLRDNLGFTSVKYACGISECGMCTVLIDGSAQRSCAVDVGDVQGSDITTIEGLPDTHPVKLAWTEAQVPQCGYCQPAIMLRTCDLLSHPAPASGSQITETQITEAQITEAVDDMVCRCGTHPRIKKAIAIAAKMTEKKGG